MSEPQARPEGIAGSSLRGPFAVGRYAAELRDFLRARTRVQLFGEVWNLHVSRTKLYFELRDAEGALPCSMWRNELEALHLGESALADGAQIVVSGGLDYYTGSKTSSPSFSFAVAALRIAGEGDLLAQLHRLRKALDAEGLFEPQKHLLRPALPRTIGVVTGEGGKARDDVLAGLRRRGWEGRVVWGFAPVQDRHAAPKITAALQDLAATGEVEVIVVACVGVEQLSAATHAAESAVPVHCGEARTALTGSARRLSVHAGRALLHRAQVLARLSRAPGEHIAGERRRLHQRLREIRAAGRRRIDNERKRVRRRALVIDRRVRAEALDALHATRLQALALALAAHDPDRTLERGYALVTDSGGNVVTSAVAARRAGAVSLRFSDAAVDATICADDDDRA